MADRPTGAAGGGPAPAADSVLARLDHVIVGSADLETGVRWVERRTGVRPQFGGEHPHFGTHNALLGLGSGRYLEVLSPRPGADVIPPLARVTKLTQPAAAMWALLSSDVEETGARLAAAGYGTIGPVPGRRIRTDDTILTWRLLFIEEPGPSLAPFFIQWEAGSARPGDDLPAACALASMHFELPAPRELGRLLEAVEVDADLRERDVEAIRVELRCPKGVVLI